MVLWNIFAARVHNPLGLARTGGSLQVQLLSISSSQTSCERNLKKRIRNVEPGILAIAQTDSEHRDSQ